MIPSVLMARRIGDARPGVAASAGAAVNHSDTALIHGMSLFMGRFFQGAK
jgi:hypothetical protein